jgi:hypothetical protein
MVEMRDDPSEVAVTVPGGVGEGAWINLIQDAGAPPRRRAGVGS